MSLTGFAKVATTFSLVAVKGDEIIFGQPRDNVIREGPFYPIKVALSIIA